MLVSNRAEGVLTFETTVHFNFYWYRGVHTTKLNKKK